MKLNRLEIKNIASIENAVIDFDADPIAGADVFLISGPTGAGKSTLLDAVSIALYGRVPRFGSVRRSGDGFDNIAVNDVRQILRQGTGKGEIRLTFDGNDGCSYESCWVVRRAHDKADRNFQRPEWTLVCNGDAASALTKTAEIQDAVVRALGIDYEQFVRTSMLAQGEFTRFLKADDREKSEILTKLTRTEIYSQIGRRIFETTRSRREEFERRKQLIAGEHLLGDEEVAALESERLAVAEEIEKAGVETAAASARLGWLERNTLLKTQLAEAEARLKTAAEVVGSEGIVTLRKEIADWKATAGARAAVRDITLAEAEMRDAREAMALLRTEYARLAGAFETLTADASQKNSEQKNAENIFQSLAWQESAFGHYEEINSLLDAVAEARRRAADMRGRMSELERKKTAGQTGAEQSRKVYSESESKFEEVRRRLSDAESNASAFDLKELTERQKELQTLSNSCTNILNSIARYDADAKGVEDSEKALAAQVLSADSARDKLPALKAQLEQAREERRLSDDLVKVLDFSNQRWAVSARATLTEGCQCPVCMQKVTQTPPAERVLAEQWRAATEKAEANRLRAERQLDLLSRAEAEIRAMDDAVAKERKRLQDKRKELRRADDEITKALGAVGLKTKEPAPVREVIAVAEKEMKGVEGNIEAAGAAQLLVQKSRKELDTAQKNKDTALDACNKAAMNLKVIETELENLRRSLLSAENEAETAAKKLKSKAELAAWAINSGEEFRSAEGFKAYFTAAYKNYTTSRQNIEKLRHESARIADMIASAKANVESILQAVPEWRDVMPEPCRDANLSTALGTLSAKVSAHAARLVSASAKKVRHEADLEAFGAANTQYSRADILHLSKIDDNTIAGKEAEVRKADDAHLAAMTAVKELKRQVSEHDAAKPEMPENETAESLKTLHETLTARIATLHSQSGSIANRLKINEEALQRVAVLKAEADAAEAEWRRWEVLNTHFGSATGDKFNRIAQSFVLRSLLDRANVHLARLTRRYRLRGIEGQYVILLEDAENDFRLRPVVTGSGGESFLVSLSLALALAEEGRDVSTDILFIDEGFGTLSGEPLQRAVAMLRSLHSASHKQVGIISHVEELKSEIPVQIRVTPTARGASSVEVVNLV